MAFPLLLWALTLNQALVSPGSGVVPYVMKVNAGCGLNQICVPSVPINPLVPACDTTSMKCVLKQGSVCEIYVHESCMDGAYCGELREGEAPVTLDETCGADHYCIDLIDNCDHKKVPTCLALYGDDCAFRVSDSCKIKSTCGGAASITAPSTTLALLVIIALCCFFT